MVVLFLSSPTYEPVKSLACLNWGLENIHFSNTDFPWLLPGAKGSGEPTTCSQAHCHWANPGSVREGVILPGSLILPNLKPWVWRSFLSTFQAGPKRKLPGTVPISATHHLLLVLELERILNEVLNLPPHYNDIWSAPAFQKWHHLFKFMVLC